MSRAAEAKSLPLGRQCPEGQKITPDDVRNMPLYTWLLIVEEDGASIEELASEVLHFDLGKDRDGAVRETFKYLRRARWINDILWPTIEQEPRLDSTDTQSAVQPQPRARME